MKLILLFSLLTACSFGQENLLGTRNARVRLELVDEDGRALANTKCAIGFRPRKGDRYEHKAVEGFTDQNGIFWAEGRTSNGLGVASDPKGYYISRRGIYLNSGNDQDDQWLPFPRLERLILKKIGKPVPMFAFRRLELTLPAANGSFNFDLEKCDWVAPHGTGVRADLIFTQKKKEDSFGGTATLRVSFANAGDGIIVLHEFQGGESDLKFPRTAPEEGYKTDIEFSTDWNSERPSTPPAKPALGYFYRVRTILDENGNVKSAWYGKIDGEFEWDIQGPETSVLTFTYYLNPDGTRNMEFDRARNLFKDLPYTNAIRFP